MVPRDDTAQYQQRQQRAAAVRLYGPRAVDQYSKWGLITNGPLQGTAFDAAGNLTAPRSQNAARRAYTGFCVGGDNSGAVGIGASLLSSVERLVGFGRIGWSLNDDNEVYATVNMAEVRDEQPAEPGRVKVGTDHPVFQPVCTGGHQAGLRGAASPVSGLGWTMPSSQHHRQPKREQERFVLGAEGAVNLWPRIGTTTPITSTA